MKIPRRLILKIAFRLISERGEVSQLDIHAAIEEYLNRQLTIGDKIRITRVVESELSIAEVRREGEAKVRVYIFRR